MWMGMNTDHPKLKDIRVRKAIQHAVDLDAVNQGAYGGTLVPMYGLVCPGLIGKRMESKYSYNPEKARQLLKEAGVSGLELTLNTLNNQERILVAQIIQANLKDVGIKVTVLPQDPGPYWDAGQESKGDMWKDLQLHITRWGSQADPYEPFQWFLEDQVGVWNWERWKNPEYDKLYQQCLIESDPIKRHAIFIRMQEIMEETGAYVWLGHEPDFFVHRTSIVPDMAPTGEMMLPYFKPA
jgi:peptide/nickel transport system substrate-binding protein